MTTPEQYRELVAQWREESHGRTFGEMTTPSAQRFAFAAAALEALDYASDDCACPDRISGGRSEPAVQGGASAEGCICPCHGAARALALADTLVAQEEGAET